MVIFTQCCRIRIYRFSLPYTPPRQLKPELFDSDDDDDNYNAFNFDDLDSDDEVPAMPNQNRLSV